MSSSADILLYNATVITLDQRKPRAEAVAIKGNLILGVGKENDLRPFKDRNTELINCCGKTIAPGFNDGHCHPLAFINSLLSVDCSPSAVRSIFDIQTRISQRVRQTQKGKWIKAMGYNKFHLDEKRHPNRWDIDKVAPNNPVKLSHYSGHACVLNSLALQLVGISKETPNPPGGIIKRDPDTNEPNGLLFELNLYVEKSIPPPSEEDFNKSVQLANEELVSHGITSLQDATRTDSSKRWQIFHRLKENETLVPRISLMIGADNIEDYLHGHLFKEGAIDNQLTPGGVKIVLNTTTGSLNLPQDRLNQLVYKAHEAGIQLVIHAVEESTLEAAIIALEYGLHGAPMSEHRHRIEHCSICPPYLMRRLKNIHAMVVTQPHNIYYHGERYLTTITPSNLNYFYPIGSLIDNKIRVAAGSDLPVEPFNPLTGIYAAVTRKTVAGQSVSPKESISRLEALKMYTINAAYSSFEEKSKGSIIPGKLADLIVLSDDPTQVPEDKLKEIKVLLTIIDGKVAWEKK